MGSGDGLAGCQACIKYLMFAFNFIFWLVGCALVGVGIWVMVDEEFKNLADDNGLGFIKYAGITIIVVGSIIMIVGFFGCCGAIRESQCLLVMFFICMFILFLALVAAGVVCLVFKDTAIEFFRSTFKGAVEKYREGDKTEGVDLIQKFFKCCGATSPLDHGLSRPQSCGDALLGCNSVVPEKLESKIGLAAGIALGAAVLMLLGMIFSMLLCCAIRDLE